jgi:2-polyprenyl-3-methyl-5-hydroxy-6-metoxy-1,4-benzoquinol methylase
MLNDLARFQNKIDELLKKNSYHNVLEAGCGSSTHINLTGNFHFTGIDISQYQLDRNANVQAKILDDIQTHEFPHESFDIIICWDVLEHLPHPDKALNRFYESLNKDGILIMAFPNLLSLKGLITKFTPLWFHICYYKTILKYKEAGTLDHGPFPTYLKNRISPNNILKYAMQNNLSVEYFELLEYTFFKKLRTRNVFLNLFFHVAGFFVHVFSFGKVSVFKSDCLFILKKTS